MKTVVFDFDGVIHSYVSGWKGENIILDPPVKGIKEVMIKLRQYGYEVVIVSTRSSTAEGTLAMVEWLGKYGFDGSYDRISAVKPPAICYVDDRAILFDGNTKGLFDRIVSFQPWNADLLRHAGIIAYLNDDKEFYRKKMEEDL